MAIPRPPKKKLKVGKEVKMGRTDRNGTTRSLKREVPKAPAHKAHRKLNKIAAYDGPISELSQEEKWGLIAELSEAVLEDPASAFASSKEIYNTDGGGGGSDTNVKENATDSESHQSHSKMRRLLDMATPTKNGNDYNTARLATLSLQVVYQDILPSYRIRLPTAAELSVRVGKETKKLWDYERALLTNYQQYLKLLERTWETEGTKHSLKKDKEVQIRFDATKTPSALAVTCILCMCEILKSAPHFNFRSNILTIVVRQMNNRQCDEVSAACCSAVESVFASDGQGEIALEATRLVAKLIKDRGFAVRPAVLRTFLSLPLRVHEDEAQAAKLAAEANAKKRKKDKETAEIENEMKEGEAKVDKIILARSQSETLHTITLTYFRILKAEGLSDKHVIELLPPALEGLAKFSHLINMDTVVDLLAVLKNMLKRAESLPLDASLNCILTAFQTLQGPGSEMQIDQKEYVTLLYNQLPRLISEENSAKHTELVLQCLTCAFSKRREYSTVRVAAFVKQICTVSLHAPAYTSAALLAFVRQLLPRYPSVHQLLENEQDIVMSGTYTPDLEDPEHSNPFATSAWELSTLKFHVHPMVVVHAKGAAQVSLLQLPSEDPLRIRSEMVRDSNECYIAQRVHQKKHPLRANNGNDKRKRPQIRFVTPRVTAKYHLKESSTSALL